MRDDRINYLIEWANLRAARRAELANQPGKHFLASLDAEALTKALGEYKLMCFAERIRNSSRAIWEKPIAIEALQLYVINKHHWTLAEATALQIKDFLFVLREEVEAMQLTAEEFAPIRREVTEESELGAIAGHFQQ